MVIRAFAIATIVSAGPAMFAAQQVAAVPPASPAAEASSRAASAAPVDPALKYPIEQLQVLLVSAVRHAAEKLAEQINALAPQFQVYTGTAKAHGIPIDHVGVVFDVEIPGVNASAIALYVLMNSGSSFQGQPAQPASPVRPVSASSEAGTSSQPPVSEADRIARIMASPAFQETPVVYRQFVSDALIDAMLDYSGPIPLKPGESLIVSARGEDGVPSPGNLIFSITQQTLVAFHSGKLTREEARQAVQVKLF